VAASPPASSVSNLAHRHVQLHGIPQVGRKMRAFASQDALTSCSLASTLAGRHESGLHVLICSRLACTSLADTQTRQYRASSFVPRRSTLFGTDCGSSNGRYPLITPPFSAVHRSRRRLAVGCSGLGVRPEMMSSANRTGSLAHWPLRTLSGYRFYERTRGGVDLYVGSYRRNWRFGVACVACCTAGGENVPTA